MNINSNNNNYNQWSVWWSPSTLRNLAVQKISDKVASLVKNIKDNYYYFNSQYYLFRGNRAKAFEFNLKFKVLNNCDIKKLQLNNQKRNQLIYLNRFLMGSINKERAAPLLSDYDTGLFMEQLKECGVSQQELRYFNCLKQVYLLQLNHKSGVCFGACMALAKRILPFISLKNIPFGETLKKCTLEYQNGIPVPGLINQLAYSSLSVQFYALVKTLHLNDLKKNIPGLVDEDRLGELEGLILKKYIEWSLAPKENKISDIDFIRSILHLDNDKNRVMSIFRDCIKIERHNTEEMIHHKKQVNHSAENLNYSQPVVTNGISSILSIVYHKIKSDIQVLSNGKEKKIIDLRCTSLEHIQLSYMLELESFNRLARARGLEYQSLELKLGKVGIKDDASYLSGIEYLDDGVYYLHFQTEKSRHATLICKHKNETYFWDPNIGLLHCSEKPEETMSAVISRHYGHPEIGSQTQHFVEILKIDLSNSY